MVYQLTSLTTLYLRFNRLVVVEAGIGNLKVSQDHSDFKFRIK